MDQEPIAPAPQIIPEDAVSDDASEYTETENDIETEEPVAKRRGFLAFLEGKWYLGLCFLVPAAILAFMYVARGVYPVGEGSVLVLDLNGQYVYFYEALRDIVTKGGSFVYTFRRALGGEFMGIFAYYLASPLSFLVALFPKRNMTEAIKFLLILKCGLTGFTFGYFLHRTRPRRPISAVMFSTMWALTAYAVVMQHNLMWTDNIILFPIVLLGIQKLIREGKLTTYAVALSLCVLSNFYIGYMTCIFSAVYFFLFYFSKQSKELNPAGVRFHLGKSFARFAATSLCAACICAVIILPTYYSLTLGKTTFSDPNFTPDLKFNIADMLTKLFFGSYDTVRPEGLPFLYTGMLTLLVAPLYFVCNKISLREKIVSSVTIVFFMLSMNVTTLDLFWHGMQKPNWLNYRYAYMLCFFLLYWGYRAFEHIREISFKWVAASFGASVALIVFLQTQKYDNFPNMGAVLPSLLILFVYVMILRGVRSGQENLASAARAVLIFAVCAEMLAAGLVNLNALDEDVVFSGRTGYRTFLDRVSVAAEELKEYDDSFYRTEKTFSRKTNDNMSLGLYGLSGSTSTLNSDTIVFLNKMGYSSKSHWSKYLGGNPVSDSLLGIKYIMAEHDDDVYEAEQIFDYPDEGLNMVTYRNTYSLSVCTAVPETVTNATFTDEGTTSPFDRLNSLVSHMRSDGVGDDVFREAEITDISTNNVKESVIAGHFKYEKLSADMTSRVNYVIKIDSEDPLFCYFPSKYTRDAGLYLNGESIGTYYENETYRIIDLGRFEPGDEITVSLELKKDELYVENEATYFRYLDTKVYEEAFADIGEYPMDFTYHTEDTLKGNITVPQGRNCIFTSIPYDKGWRVTCDGESVATTEILDALLAFRLPEGEHEVTIEYKPDSVKYGNIISVAGLAAFTMLALSNRMLIKRAASKAVETETARTPAGEGGLTGAPEEEDAANGKTDNEEEVEQ